MRLYRRSASLCPPCTSCQPRGRAAQCQLSGAEEHGRHGSEECISTGEALVFVHPARHVNQEAELRKASCQDSGGEEHGRHGSEACISTGEALVFVHPARHANQQSELRKASCQADKSARFLPQRKVFKRKEAWDCHQEKVRGFGLAVGFAGALELLSFVTATERTTVQYHNCERRVRFPQAPMFFLFGWLALLMSGYRLFFSCHCEYESGLEPSFICQRMELSVDLPTASLSCLAP
uniref:Uncharacterized protein n=1 Tax=Ramularia collo-cygni TaxID=112498 RepID=A0A2D3VCH8_9PEZI